MAAPSRAIGRMLRKFPSLSVNSQARAEAGYQRLFPCKPGYPPVTRSQVRGQASVQVSCWSGGNAADSSDDVDLHHSSQLENIMKMALPMGIGLLMVCGVAQASQKCEAEVEFSRTSANGRQIEYTVAIRHHAPTELANVGYSYRFDYTGTDGKSHTVHGNAGHSTARRRDQQRSYTAANNPNPPVASLEDATITGTTCWYN